MRAELVGLRGGLKQQFLRLHRSEIITYCETNGAEATMQEYSIRRRSTLDKLISARSRHWERRTNSDKALDLARLALEDNAMTRAEVRRMRRHFNELAGVVVTQLAKGIVKALSKVEIELPAELPEFQEINELAGVSNFVESCRIEAEKPRLYVMSRNKHI